MLLARAHPNVVAVALASKLPRNARAVLRSGADYGTNVFYRDDERVGPPRSTGCWRCRWSSRRRS
jgi:hypothetical protein